MARFEECRFVIVQHAEKQRLPGDPGLTTLGRHQADRVASQLAASGAIALYSSPQRRALETAVPISQATGLNIVIDDRLRERMNWEGPSQQTAEAFLAEWEQTNADRGHVPTSGDSSRSAASRFEQFLDDTTQLQPAGVVLVVSHGGVTVDLLRNLLGNTRLKAVATDLIGQGMPCGGLTTLASGPRGWAVLGVGYLPIADRDRRSEG